MIAALLLAAVAGFFVLRPVRQRLRVEELARLEAELGCCTSGAVRFECQESLRELVALAQTDSLARAQVDGCDVAREMDPRLPHPPSQRMCGWLASFEERRAAGRELGKGVAAAGAAKSCRQEGRDAALAVVQADFENLCGEDLCLPLLASAPEDPKTRRMAQAHADAMLALLASPRKVPAETQRALLSAAYPQGWPALWAILFDDEVHAGDLSGLLDVEGADLGPVRRLREVHTPAGARAHLVLYARGAEPMSADDEARACEASSCAFLSSFSADQLHFDEPARRAACKPRLSACHLDADEPDAGVSLPFEKTDAGAYVFGGRPLMDVDRRDPAGAMGRCLGLVVGCTHAGRTLDQCWPEADVCETAQPWNEATPCCPPACAARYKALRGAGRSDRDALTAVASERSCFPGVPRQ